MLRKRTIVSAKNLPHLVLTEHLFGADVDRLVNDSWNDENNKALYSNRKMGNNRLAALKALDTVLGIAESAANPSWLATCVAWAVTTPLYTGYKRIVEKSVEGSTRNEEELKEIEKKEEAEREILCALITAGLPALSSLGLAAPKVSVTGAKVLFSTYWKKALSKAFKMQNEYISSNEEEASEKLFTVFANILDKPSEELQIIDSTVQFFWEKYFEPHYLYNKKKRFGVGVSPEETAALPSFSNVKDAFLEHAKTFDKEAVKFALTLVQDPALWKLLNKRQGLVSGILKNDFLASRVESFKIDVEQVVSSVERNKKDLEPKVKAEKSKKDQMIQATPAVSNSLSDGERASYEKRGVESKPSKVVLKRKKKFKDAKDKFESNNKVLDYALLGLENKAAFAFVRETLVSHQDEILDLVYKNPRVETLLYKYGISRELIKGSVLQLLNNALDVLSKPENLDQTSELIKKNRIAIEKCMAGGWITKAEIVSLIEAGVEACNMVDIASLVTKDVKVVEALDAICKTFLPDSHRTALYTPMHLLVPAIQMLFSKRNFNAIAVSANEIADAIIEEKKNDKSTTPIIKAGLAVLPRLEVHKFVEILREHASAALRRAYKGEFNSKDDADQSIFKIAKLMMQESQKNNLSYAIKNAIAEVPTLKLKLPELLEEQLFEKLLKNGDAKAFVEALLNGKTLTDEEKKAVRKIAEAVNLDLNNVIDNAPTLALNFLEALDEEFFNRLLNGDVPTLVEVLLNKNSFEEQQVQAALRIAKAVDLGLVFDTFESKTNAARKTKSLLNQLEKAYPNNPEAEIVKQLSDVKKSNKEIEVVFSKLDTSNIFEEADRSAWINDFKEARTSVQKEIVTQVVASLPNTLLKVDAKEVEAFEKSIKEKKKSLEPKVEIKKTKQDELIQATPATTNALSDAEKASYERGAENVESGEAAPDSRVGYYRPLTEKEAQAERTVGLALEVVDNKEMFAFLRRFLVTYQGEVLDVAYKIPEVKASLDKYNIPRELVESSVLKLLNNALDTLSKPENLDQTSELIKRNRVAIEKCMAGKSDKLTKEEIVSLIEAGVDACNMVDIASLVTKDVKVVEALDAVCKVYLPESYRTALYTPMHLLVPAIQMLFSKKNFNSIKLSANEIADVVIETQKNKSDQDPTKVITPAVQVGLTVLSRFEVHKFIKILRDHASDALKKAYKGEFNSKDDADQSIFKIAKLIVDEKEREDVSNAIENAPAVVFNLLESLDEQFFNRLLNGAIPALVEAILNKESTLEQKAQAALKIAEVVDFGAVFNTLESKAGTSKKELMKKIVSALPKKIVEEHKAAIEILEKNEDLIFKVTKLLSGQNFKAMSDVVPTLLDIANKVAPDKMKELDPKIGNKSHVNKDTAAMKIANAISKLPLSDALDAIEIMAHVASAEADKFIPKPDPKGQSFKEENELREMKLKGIKIGDSFVHLPIQILQNLFQDKESLANITKAALDVGIDEKDKKKIEKAIEDLKAFSGTNSKSLSDAQGFIAKVKEFVKIVKQYVAHIKEVVASPEVQLVATALSEITKQAEKPEGQKAIADLAKSLQEKEADFISISNTFKKQNPAFNHRMLNGIDVVLYRFLSKEENINCFFVTVGSCSRLSPMYFIKNTSPYFYLNVVKFGFDITTTLGVNAASIVCEVMADKCLAVYRDMFNSKDAGGIGAA